MSTSTLDSDAPREPEPSAASRPPQSDSATTSVIRGYLGGSHEELPIAGYATMMTLFLGLFSTLAIAARRSHVLPERIASSDIALIGVATHKLTRIVSRDRIAIPLRAPFTEYQGTDGAGQVKERPRGPGLRRAIGSLVLCQYCVGPWVASVLATGLVFAPRVTRLFASVFAMVTISDFLHQGYASARNWSK